MNYEDSPTWLRAADSHNIAAHNDSIFSNIGRRISNIPSAIIVSAASGLNSFYNSGIAIANVFNSEENKLAYNDTAEWITSFDDDLGRYYEENRNFADLAGFIGTSLVPGLAGVKALGAGQRALQAASAGQVGTNMSRATGLLAPAYRTAVERQAANLASRQQSWSLFSRDTLGVIGRGTQQGVLEGIAFEGAVMATMFQSPIFDDMDGIDLVKNMSIGVALGGGLGTVIGGVSSYFNSARALRRADTRQQELATRFTPMIRREYDQADRITASAFDREAVAREITPEEVLNMKRAQGETGEAISPAAVDAEVRNLNSLREQNIERINNTIRTEIRGLNRPAVAKNKDNNFGNFVADLFGRQSFKATSDLFENMQSYVREGDELITPRLIKDFAKANNIPANEARNILNSRPQAHVQLHSGGIGDILSEAPTNFTRLADRLNAEDISKYVRARRFTAKKSVDFSKAVDSSVAEARWIWARDLAKPLDSTQQVHAYDLPLLSKAVRDGNDTLVVKLPNGSTQQLESVEEIAEFYRNAQGEVATAQIELQTPAGKIELLSDIRADSLQGAGRYAPDDPRNFTAQASYAEELSETLGREVSALELHNMPKYLKAVYKDAVTDEDLNIYRGMQAIKYQQKLYQEDADRAVASYFGNDSSAFIEYSEEALRRTWRGGTGQGTFTNSGGTYGSTEAITSANATVFSRIKREKLKQLRESLTGDLNTLLSDQQLAVRFSAVNEQLANQVEKFVMNADNTALVPRKLRDFEEAIAQGRQVTPPRLAEGTPRSIPLDDQLAKIVSTHIDLTAGRNRHFDSLMAAQGNASRKFDDTYYPYRLNPRDYRHVAIVVDDKISGVGHKKMILAQSGEELEGLIAKVPKEYRIVRRNQAEEFYQASGEYNYDRTLHENYLDVDLNSKGVMSNFFPQTDPSRIADTYLQHHTRSETALLHEAMATKFQPFIQQMEKLGDIYSQTRGSATGWRGDLDVSSKNNPYAAQIKSLFDITRIEDAPNWWVSANRALDRTISRAWNSVADISRNSRLSEPERIQQINDAFDSVGFKSAYYDAATNVMANSRVPRGILSGFVRKANAFLTSTILRLDAFNALNNKLGNQIIMSAEINSLLRGIREANPEIAGELAGISRVAVPGSGGDTILSGPKLIAESYRLLHGEGREQLIRQLEAHGLVPDLTQQYYQALDSMTLTGSETVRDMARKSEQLSAAWNKFVEGGSRLTGNEWAERMNRLSSAVVMKQITDRAVRAGVITEPESWAYINMFVNRVNGVVRAAERPLMFQGPIGQSMGLFQSYQMNLIQQTLRLAGHGDGRALAMLVGMQSSIYGASSLPAFNLINHSLIGTAAGNENHEDLYSISQTLFGQEGSEWLMYGAPSNILNASLYTRGNTNPRVWHVVPNPTNPEDIPFISAFSNAIGAVKGAMTSVQNGAPVWESALHGLEHSGLSRPLAGLAATARGLTSEDGTVYTTQRSGNFLYENDLLSWSTLMRVAGAKPIDEAVMQNNYFRIQAYASADRDRRNQIGQAIRLSIQSGDVPSTEDINSFAERYVSRGGDVQNFNQYWMSQYRNATTSQAEQLSTRLQNPYGRRMQQLMGGMESNNVRFESGY